MTGIRARAAAPALAPALAIALALAPVSVLAPIDTAFAEAGTTRIVCLAGGVAAGPYASFAGQLGAVLGGGRSGGGGAFDVVDCTVQDATPRALARIYAEQARSRDVVLFVADAGAGKDDVGARLVALRDALADVAATAAKHGARVVAITRPHGIRFDETAPPAGVGEERARALRAERHVLDAANFALRAAAADLGIAVLDASARFAERDPDLLFAAPLPGDDPAGLGPLGQRLLAEETAAFLRDLDPRAFPAGAAAPRLQEEIGAVAVATLPQAGTRAGRDAVLLAAAIGERTVLLRVDPASRHCAPVPVDLAAPTAPLAMLYVRTLGGLTLAPEGEVLFALPLADGRTRLFTRTLSGGEGAVPPVDLALVPAGAVPRLCLVDFAGDGRPEVAAALATPATLDRGPSGAPVARLLDERLRPIGVVGFGEPEGAAGLFLAAARTAGGRDVLLAAPLATPDDRPWVRMFEASAPHSPGIALLADAGLGLRDRPTLLAAGRFLGGGTGGDDLLVVRPPAVALFGGAAPFARAGEVWFPWGAVRFDATRPEPALCPMHAAPDEPAVLIAARHEHAIAVWRVALALGGTVAATPAFEVPLE